jgi:dTDP-4-dehydrorhamnose 3,5-epimerase
VKIVEVKDLPLPGAKLVLYKRFMDVRGYFSETYRQADFDELAGALGLDEFKIAQINESYSTAGVVRGLHFQYDPPQGKLIRLLFGHGIDLSVDARRSSPTRGKMIMVDLLVDPRQELGQWLWLPPGLAHGNYYLADSALEYICTAPYNPDGEVGLNPLDDAYDFSLCDPELRRGFKTLIEKGPVVSDKDAQGVAWTSWQSDPRGGNV